MFRALNPDSVLIMSHAAFDDYERLHTEYPSLEFTIRCKTGPGHLGTYPSDILDYKEWENERSLANALDTLESMGKTLRVQMGNEPDIEMARESVDDPTNRREAIDNYVAWYRAESEKIRLAFPAAQLSPAPLSQGNRARWLHWAMDMHECFRDADFIAVHAYTPEGTSFDDPDWGGQWKWYRAAYADKPLMISETNMNGPMDPERMADYISHIAATGEVDGVDVFTTPGGQRDSEAEAWWFLTPEMATIAGDADRNAKPVIILDPIEPEPVEEPVANYPTTDEEAILACKRSVWHASEASAPVGELTPGHGMDDHFIAHMGDMGVPVGQEYVIEDEMGPARAYRGFVPAAVWRWHRDDGVSKVA